MHEQLEQIRELIRELEIPPYLLTYAEAAEILGVKAQTMRNWVSKGKISYVKIGRSVRFRRDQLNDFIEQSTKKGEV